MAAITVRRSVFLLPINPLFSLQGLYHKIVEGGEAKFVENGDAKAQLLDQDDRLIFKTGEVDVSKWKRLDSRNLEITRTMVPPAPYCVLQILRSKGFEAYLVGGCVRDLILKRTPKDFDVITTADLDQIRKQFHRNEVVGQRFPVCRVHIKGSVVEVTSFNTLARDADVKEKFLISHMPDGSNKFDLIRWKNSMHRDFTINSLFFDPFNKKIYDYNDGIKDLLELKQLRTLVPAQLSFTEDSGRILRCMRIAARLGLSLSKEIKSAIFENRSSISTLGQFRTTMELNYMLSFGAAESSISLLHKYQLLEILLPFQAAYISQQMTRSGQSSMMLMKLLSNMDKLVACERPSGRFLWIGLLGFHMALVNNPQHPFVIMTFASVLYHQNWEDGLKSARKHGQTPINFDPETLEPHKPISDDEIAEKVKQLRNLVLDSIDILVETDSLKKAMTKFPAVPCSGLVFISRNMGRLTRQIFNVLGDKLETYRKERTSSEINYHFLGKGDFVETRFALGMIILETMGCHLPFSSKNVHFANEKIDTKPLLPLNLDPQQGCASKKQTAIEELKLSSIVQSARKQDFFQDELGDLQEGVNEDRIMHKPEISTRVNRNTQVKIDNARPTFQNQEERVNRNTQVKIDELETNLLWSVETNCKRAVEEAKDSPVDMRKLNQFLVGFLEEQTQRKKTEAPILVVKPKNSESPILEVESKSSESCILEVESKSPESPILEVESKNSKSPILEVESKNSESCILEVESKNSESPILEVESKNSKSSVNGERKKQKRACSYCKEKGHNKAGCPKRKIEENKILQIEE